MGMTRLAVIDLDTGDQPMFNEDKTIAVVFNGEIYNYQELRRDLIAKGHRFTSKGDTEVLVHLYEELGAAMVLPLRGMFTFAVHDVRQRKVLLARDRFGKKPLYLARVKDGFVFGSEIKAVRPFLDRLGMTVGVSQQAVADYLSLGVVPQPQTIYREVESLPAAHVAILSHRGVEISRYWSPRFEPKHNVDSATAVEEVRRLIRESVRLRLRSDVPLGLFLSGGVDSSVVAYEAAIALGSSVQSYTIAMEEGFDESPVAKRTAKALGIHNTVLPVSLDPVKGLDAVLDAYDQPFADSSAIPSLQLAAAAREHVTVVLNGDGGDELFGGYRRYVAARPYDRMPATLGRVLAAVGHLVGGRVARRSTLGFAARLTAGLTLEESERYLAWTSDMLRREDKRLHWRGGVVTPTEALVSSLTVPATSALDRMMALDHGLNLSSDLLVKMDIACMASSLEARSPLLDHVLAEYAFRLPDSLKVHGTKTKYVLRKAYADVLPREVLISRKRGFEIPLAGWLASDLRPLIRETVGARDAEVKNYLDAALVDGVLFGNTLVDRNVPYLQYALLVLELWLRRSLGK
jgi:asparagine synthase (glutamine-hydrolysing)